MKYNIIFLIALMVIIAVTVDRVEDAISDIIFKEDTISFMEKGGRNTSAMGYVLCNRLNETESRLRIPSTDCESIYKANGG